MTHNLAYSKIFRFRNLAWLAFLAAAPVLCAARAPFPQKNAPAAVFARTQTGVDVLEAEKFAPLRGLRVGVITNQTGVDSQGRRTIDLLAHTPGVKLVAIFSPEHGIAGLADADVSNGTDAPTGLPIYSLYGATRRPTDAMLEHLDALVFDIQDAGVRFYTFTTTMAYCMEAAAQHHIAFFVLDRPDPLGGQVIEGPMLDPGRTSFVGYFPMPVRYAMTLGELAEMFNAENKIGAALHVIPMKNWRREETYSQTGLAWIAPSPNLRNLNAALLYPGIEILQDGGVSVGRGTDAPFEIFGAPWIHAAEFVAALNLRKIPGVDFAPAQFTPDDGLYKGRVCQGATISITGRAALHSMYMGLVIADELHRMYPDQFQLGKIIGLLGSQSTLDRLQRGDDPEQIVDGWKADLAKFAAMRDKYLLYK
ncbi:MAG: exo-beta-N-acetylmuramidase NamZ family protein [Candidatus Acidiferrales bacterium]